MVSDEEKQKESSDGERIMEVLYVMCKNGTLNMDSVMGALSNEAKK